VSFIDPNFIDEPDGLEKDDGAPADIAAGQHLIATVVNAVIQGPKWNKTLLRQTDHFAAGANRGQHQASSSDGKKRRFQAGVASHALPLSAS